MSFMPQHRTTARIEFNTTHHSAFSGSMWTTSAKPVSAPSGSLSNKPARTQRTATNMETT